VVTHALSVEAARQTVHNAKPCCLSEPQQAGGAHDGPALTPHYSGVLLMTAAAPVHDARSVVGPCFQRKVGAAALDDAVRRHNSH